MSSYAPFQDALADVIKAEVQAAVTKQYQVEVGNLRNALAIAQHDLNSTRNALDDLRAAFTTTENDLNTTRSELDSLHKAFNSSSQNKSRKDPVDMDNRRYTLTVAENDVPILQDNNANWCDTPVTTKKELMVTPRASLHNAKRHLSQVPEQLPAVSNPVANPVHANFAPMSPSEAALRHYAKGLRLQFKNTLPYAIKLCGTSDPWVIQELLNKQMIDITTSKFNSFKRVVLKSHNWHPITHVMNEKDNMADMVPHATVIRSLRMAITRHAPGARLTLPDCFFNRTVEENGPVVFRIDNTERYVLHWDLCCRLAQDCHRILKDTAAVDTFCLVVENRSVFFHYHSLLFLSRS